MTLLGIEGLNLDLGDRPILRDLNLSLGPGAAVGLVGESGSGKSMTALAIAGLAPESARLSGTIRFEGVDVNRAPEAVLRSLRGQAIAFVFQEPMTALNPLHPIGRQVSEAARVHGRISRGEADRLARATLDRVGLASVDLERRPHQLSGGQRQRVAIAAAIALKPRLLIADEPTTALDVTAQAEILSLLKRLTREDGAALILISHDLAVVADVCSHVAVMQAGRIVEQGPTGMVLRRPSHPYTRRLLAAAKGERASAPRRITGDRPFVLEARGLSYSHSRLGGRPASGVDDVTFSLSPGETVALVGQSGAGKSTLVRLLLGLLTPSKGEIRVGGRSLSNPRGAPDRRQRRMVQAVFQDPYASLNPRWRVDRLVAEPLHLLDAPLDAHERRSRVEAMLGRVGLEPEAADRYPHAFSGGQRQRIAIARALIARPEAVLLDEAVSALDVTLRAQILDLIADLAAELGVGWLFVTHDLAVVRRVADRVLVMRAGRIVEAGSALQVLTDPQHPYTEALLKAAPDLERSLAALD